MQPLTIEIAKRLPKRARLWTKRGEEKKFTVVWEKNDTHVGVLVPSEQWQQPWPIADLMIDIFTAAGLYVSSAVQN